MECFLFAATIALSAHCQPLYDVEGRVATYVAKVGYRPHSEAIKAIVKASETFQVNPITLARIAILESSFNPKQKPHQSPDGTWDFGLFQINEINRDTICNEFNVMQVQGNAMCAAKILSELRVKWSARDQYWIARYNSKNPVNKAKYWRRFASL